MMLKKRIDKTHYNFNNYVNKKRWLSIWHQLDEVISLNPSSVLEVGPGPGIFKKLAGHFGVSVETVDIDPGLKPDYVASVTDLPFSDNAYDCVCAFQVLEHIPYKQALQAFGEMVRIADNHIFISLPDAKRLWIYSLNIPKMGQKIIHIPRPQLRQIEHQFDGQHYWEINKLNYPLKKIIGDFTKNRANLKKTYRVPENPYHRFFLFEKI